MADTRPAYDDQGLLDRIGKAAREADLGAHRQVYARMLPTVRPSILLCGVLAVVLAVATVMLTVELFTRTDGDQLSDIGGLVCFGPFLLAFGYAFISHMYMSLFGPATFRAVRLDLYERGLVSADADRLRVLRYDTTEIRQSLVREMLYGVFETRTTHDYEVLDIAGEKFSLKDFSQGGPPDAIRWGAAIQDAVQTAQLPIAAEKLRRGDHVSFDRLWLTARGLGDEDKTIPWPDVRHIEIRDGRLRVHKTRRLFTACPVREIPNLHLFLTLARDLMAQNQGPGVAAPAYTAPDSPASPADNFPTLLAMVIGDKTTAEALIAVERDRLPTADRATWIARAIDRLRQERERRN
ncbi:DUF6585 family protein [Nocardia sp. NPDC005825]|uniref:DUF6585 family protein n=1 Tax=unclassified Nocardia TaxID=2637762 RepID=UPI0033CAA339